MLDIPDSESNRGEFLFHFWTIRGYRKRPEAAAEGKFDLPGNKSARAEDSVTQKLMHSNSVLIVDQPNQVDALITRNVEWLGQAFDLLQQISDEQFTQSPAGLEPHRVGPHLRHVLEFYECFLAGLPTGYIDYDRRARDERIERSRHFAATTIRDIQRRLTTCATGSDDTPVLVCMEDAAASGVPAPWLTSSMARELQVLASHTTHHYALISMTLRALGVALDPDFGVAPATLSYRRRPETARAS